VVIGSCFFLHDLFPAVVFLAVNHFVLRFSAHLEKAKGHAGQCRSRNVEHGATDNERPVLWQHSTIGNYQEKAEGQADNAALELPQSRPAGGEQNLEIWAI
jgi:hypothetical protein